MKKKTLNLDRKLVLHKGQVTVLTAAQEGNVISARFPICARQG